MCHDRGHYWGHWTLWTALWPPAISSPEPGPPAPAPINFPKVRERSCLRCGARQSQDGDGTITDVEARR